MLTVAAVLKGKAVHPNVSLGIAPGSKQVLSMLAETGALTDIIASGARVLESACGPCIGMGQSPRSKGVSLRTFNRNFQGRSGTEDADVYLVSPEVAVAAAITGTLTDPRELGDYPKIKMPAAFSVDDSMIILPPADRNIDITRGPNIKPFPKRGQMEDSLELSVLLKLEDNITTDDIMPAGSKILPLRSNIEKISKYVFSGIDNNFSERAVAAGSGCVLARNNYGQGSSREHAAIAPMYLGIKAVLAVTFARIHRANLINFGILPVTIDESSYSAINNGDKIRISNILNVLNGTGQIKIENISSGKDIEGKLTVSEREAALLRAGGLLNYIKSRAGN
jgi:aconitate hydratase